MIRRLRKVSVRLRVIFSFLLFFPVCLVVAQTPSTSETFSPPARSFRFTYNFVVKDIPADAKTVRVLALKAPGKTRMTRETEYGNRMMYAEIQNPAAGKAEFNLEYKVTRREYSRGNYRQLERTDQEPSLVPASMNR